MENLTDQQRWSYLGDMGEAPPPLQHRVESYGGLAAIRTRISCASHGLSVAPMLPRSDHEDCEQSRVLATTFESPDLVVPGLWVSAHDLGTPRHSADPHPRLRALDIISMILQRYNQVKSQAFCHGLRKEVVRTMIRSNKCAVAFSRISATSSPLKGKVSMRYMCGSVPELS